MKHRPFDPCKLDVSAFAAEGAHLSGDWPLSDMDRISGLVPAEAGGALTDVVHWELDGERKGVRAGLPEVWLHLKASAKLPLECQRCLQPVFIPLDIESHFRFAATEEEAEELDADSEHDVLVLERSLDSRELIEDELLLALPVVALHDECPEPLPVPPDDLEEGEDEAENPFAALAGLKLVGDGKEEGEDGGGKNGRGGGVN